MYHDLKQIYWLDGIKKDIAEYVAKFPNYQLVKEEHLKPCGLTKIIKVPTLTWEALNMEIVVSLTNTRRQHDSVWVIVDMINKPAHFIIVKSTYRAEDYARRYIDEIVRWHMIPLSIISDRGA